jgi:hypothetical protein
VFVVLRTVFETFNPVTRWRDGPHARAVVGLLSALYVVALLAFVAVGPFVVSAVTDLSFAVALQRVVVAAGAGYVVGMAVLLR